MVASGNWGGACVCCWDEEWEGGGEEAGLRWEGWDNSLEEDSPGFPEISKQHHYDSNSYIAYVVIDVLLLA